MLAGRQRSLNWYPRRAMKPRLAINRDRGQQKMDSFDVVPPFWRSVFDLIKKRRTQTPGNGQHLQSGQRRLAAVLAVAFLGACATAARSQPSERPGQQPNAIGYATVGDAMRALKEKPGSTLTLTKPDDWTIINEPSPVYTQWSFAPPGHYAYPAVVRRGIKITENGDASIETTSLCEAPKSECDRLLSEFQQMTDRSKQNVQKQISGSTTR
jgi:hypothetical protein